MPFPGVNVAVGNRNLLANINVPDAVPAIIMSSSDSNESITELYGPDDSLPIGKLLRDFYTEVGGSVRLLVMKAPPVGNPDLSQAFNTLLSRYPDVNLVAIVPDVSTHTYENHGALCDEVARDVALLKPILAGLQAKGMPVRVLYGASLKLDGGTEIGYDAKSAGNGYVGVVLGNSDKYTTSAVGVALGRATRIGAHVKVGDGTLGPLSLSEVYYDGKRYEEVGTAVVERWHDQGYLTFMRRPGQEGWYFGVDNMCSDDDYSTLVHGRVIDKVQRIAIAAYMPYVESPIDMADDGTIDVADAESMAKIIDSQLRAQMSDQVSNVRVVVPVEQDLIGTKTLRVQVSVLPLGYNTWISVELNLAARLD